MFMEAQFLNGAGELRAGGDAVTPAGWGRARAWLPRDAAALAGDWVGWAALSPAAGHMERHV